MSFYDKHVFFCTNQRENGEACCGNHRAQQARDYVKNKAKELGIANHLNKIRINSAAFRAGRSSWGTDPPARSGTVFSASLKESVATAVNLPASP